METLGSAAAASEAYAFAYLRAMHFVSSMVTDEQSLVRLHPGQRVPEGIFRSHSGDQCASVEVKRIPSLQRADGTRAWHGGFAWKATIVSAMEKAHAGIVDAHGVRVHHIVLCTPDDARVHARVERHARRILCSHVASCLTACAVRRVVVHVLRAPSDVMDLE